KHVNADDIVEEYYAYGKELAQYVTDTSVVLNEGLDDGKRVLFEGAQGVMLDIDQGTYPFVTSSNPVAGGVTIGSGVGPSKIDHVVGVSKAYTTRVGDGPFPRELDDEIGERMRDVGNEYGTTTGRPRRVGWFDSVVVRHAGRVSGITDLSLNSLDVMTGIDTVKICVAYRYKGETLHAFPASLSVLAECEPIYEEMPGWHEDISDVRNLGDLRENDRHNLERILHLTGMPLWIFYVVPSRTDQNTD